MSEMRFYVEGGYNLCVENIDVTDPLESSIKKWEFIKEWIENNPGKGLANYGDTCAFCEVHFYGHYQNECGECPVREKTGKILCEGTPWRPVIRVPEEAQAEIDFLKSLREEQQDG